MINNKELSFNLCQEEKLLINCARTRINKETGKKISSLTSQDLDWEYIIKLAFQHKITPLVYLNLNRICPEKVPDGYLNILRQHFHENTRKNLLLTGELVKIMKLLKDNNVNAFTYKGPVLAHSVYGNIGYRQFGDIDIFINKADALKAKNIMLFNGYKLDPPLNVTDSYYLKLDAEYRFRSSSGVLIEINWNFAGTFFSLPTISEFLYKDLDIVEINNTPFYTPSTTNQLLMLCIHCAKHDWSKFSWICDISEFIESQNIDWNETLEKSRILGLKRILLINLLLVHQIFEINIPPLIKEQLKEKSVEYLSFNIIQILFKKKILNIFGKFFLDLKKRDKIIFGIKDSIYGLTNPTYTDFLDIKLPDKLFFLYRLIRPFLLLKRYGIDSIK